MARQVRRISELPEATELTGDELLEIVQDGNNKRVPVSMLADGGAVQSVQGRTGDVVITADDVGLGNVDNTSDADKPVSTAQQAALDGKVDKVAGMGLSSNDFTDPLRDKLIGLEGTHWRGTFVSLEALQSGVTDPEAGDYADVDNVGADVERYIWDATDGIWVVQSGAVAPITASQVKQLYESNPDTNAFTDADVSKLGDVQPWATAPTQDAAQTALGMSASGKAVATGTPAQGRTALGLGTAALVDRTSTPQDRTAGRLLRVGDAGIHGNIPISAGSVVADWNTLQHTSFYTVTTTEGLNRPVTAWGVLLVWGDGGRAAQMYIPDNGNVYYFRAMGASSTWRAWRTMYHTANTTVDSNGFLKSASPILKLHSDRVESNNEDGPAFERIDTGHYQLSNTNGLRLDDGWYIETPHDKNGNKYFNVEWEQDHTPETDAGVLEEPADVTLTIRCYERVWNPATGQFDNGDPVDIPAGRWIDLRMNEVRQPEPEDIDELAPEQPVEPTEPVIPSVVTMAQAKLALLYAGLFEAAEQYINELPEPQKTAALIEWNHRQTLEREHPLVGQVADGLGLTEQQLDELFLDASTR